MSPKFAPRCGARAIWKSKSSKTGIFGSWAAQNLRHACSIWKSKSLKADGVGAFLEVQASKICTTLWCKSDWEVKIVKAPGARRAIGGSYGFSRFRCRDFDRLQNTRQAQEFVRVQKRWRAWRASELMCGRRRDLVVCNVDVWGLGRWINGRVAKLFRGRRSTFEASA